MGSPTRKSEKTIRTRIEIVEQRWKPRASAGQRYSPDQVVERPRREYSGQDTQGRDLYANPTGLQFVIFGKQNLSQPDLDKIWPPATPHTSSWPIPLR